MIDVGLLSRLADICRKGLQSLAKESGSLFVDFPSGSCDYAAELVGRVLKEQAGYDGVYVCGVGHTCLTPNQTHAWYEVGEYIIDITYDQFEDTGMSGWIFPREAGWHAEFEELNSRDSFCMPSGWPCYPFDGYDAIKLALAA